MPTETLYIAMSCSQCRSILAIHRPRRTHPKDGPHVASIIPHLHPSPSRGAVPGWFRGLPSLLLSKSFSWSWSREVEVGSPTWTDAYIRRPSDVVLDAQPATPTWPLHQDTPVTAPSSLPFFPPATMKLLTRYTSRTSTMTSSGSSSAIRSPAPRRPRFIVRLPLYCLLLSFAAIYYAFVSFESARE